MEPTTMQPEERMVRSPREADVEVWKGALAGAVAGAAGAFVMNVFQTKVMQPVKEALKEAAGGQQDTGGDGGGGGQGEPATVKAANALSERVLHRELTDAQKEKAGPAMHYAMGTTTGAIYGATAEVLPLATVGNGLAFGAVVWAMADEAAVPALGLSKSPAEYPLSTHLEALVSHLVYGVATETVRRGIRAAM